MDLSRRYAASTTFERLNNARPLDIAAPLCSSGNARLVVLDAKCTRRQVLDRIIVTVSKQHPVQGALHLMTRIPYVQTFPNGNKRGSRMAADAALLDAGLLPESFAHVNKASSIWGMSVFYELGSLAAIEQAFLRGYVRSIVLASHIPIRMRGAGFDMDAVVDALLGYVMTGKRPRGAVVEAFFG